MTLARLKDPFLGLRALARHEFVGGDQIIEVAMFHQIVAVGKSQPTAGLSENPIFLERISFKFSKFLDNLHFI